MSPRPRSQRRDDDLEPDPLVEALVPDPAAGAPDLRVLVGFVGRGGAAGRVRLYTDEAMSTYFELDAGDVVHRERLPEGHPLGGASKLYVSGRAELRLVESRPVDASLLGGPLADSLLPTAAVGGQSAFLTPTVTTTTTVVPVTIWSWLWPNQCGPIFSRLSPFATGCRPPGCPGAWTFCLVTLF